MGTIIAVAFLLAHASMIHAGYSTPCEIEGVDQNEWYYGKQLSQKVPDSQRGPFVEFSTRNVVGIKDQTSVYLEATFKDHVLQLRPNSKFGSFDEDYKDGASTLLEIAIELECSGNTFETMKFRVRVEDVNDNAPVFDRSVYEYHFGMVVPEDYRLTDILPISVIDGDFSNNLVYFTVEYNTYISLGYHGKRKDYDDNYFTTAKTLTEIKAPFKQEFTIVATDSGIPPKSSTARLVLTVSANESFLQQNPFIFSKSLYVINHAQNHLQITEPIKLTCPTQISLRQRGFEKNFKIEVRPDGIVQITTLQSISDRTASFVVIDLEATCGHVSEQSSLVVSFVQDSSDSGLVVCLSAAIACVLARIFYARFRRHHKRLTMSLPL